MSYVYLYVTVFLEKGDMQKMIDLPDGRMDLTVILTLIY